jgi:hypothetical protein
MAVEAKRGCGYRKAGGLYLVGGGVGIPCDRLPFELTCCPTCSQGIKQARGWTWVDVAKLFNGPHLVTSKSVMNETATGPAQVPCGCGLFNHCPLCNSPELLGRAGLLWIGEKFYKTPDKFIAEGVSLGFSRRIKTVPQGFKVGETWVLLAHAKAVRTPAVDPQSDATYKPGIFYVWLPQRLEKIVLESTRGTEEIEALERRGITPVFVPDEDRDHQGNVHDDFEEEKKRGGAAEV